MKFIVIGGGLTGTLACGLLKKYIPRSEVINVRSKNLPTIGVGESTTPFFIKGLTDLGVLTDLLEQDFISPKYGLKFINWHSKDLFNCWILNNFQCETINYLYGLSKNKFLGRIDNRIEEQLIPYDKINSKFFTPVALHIDANKTAEFIFNKIADRFITIYGSVISSEVSEKGISSIKLDTGQELSGDIYIDCSGFSRVLIKKLASNFYKSTLPVNSAIFQEAKTNIEKVDLLTSAIACKAGWVWNIPFKTRGSGIGYVFNNAFISKEDAVLELSAIKNTNPDNSNYMTFEGGWYKDSYSKNVVSFGVASGFLDALDASTIHVTLLQIYDFISNINNHADYNKKVVDLYNHFYRYLTLYYKTCIRQEDYWKSISSLSEQELLDEFISLYRKPFYNKNNIIAESDSSGFTRSFLSRIITNRINIDNKIIYKILRQVPTNIIADNIKIFNKTNKLYEPYTRNLFKQHVINNSESNYNWYSGNHQKEDLLRYGDNSFKELR